MDQKSKDKWKQSHKQPAQLIQDISSIKKLLIGGASFFFFILVLKMGRNCKKNHPAHSKKCFGQFDIKVVKPLGGGSG